jgi:hypothetical protein
LVRQRFIIDLFRASVEFLDDGHGVRLKSAKPRKKDE